MPVISKIRFTNVIYENGNKRYQDEIFHFDGNNSTIVLENGGGKTVWVQAALQAILPHTEVAGRKVYETFLLSEGCAHIAIEWIISQKPRRYLVTAVSLYEQSQKLQSYRYVYEYGENDAHSLENIPYVEEVGGGAKRPTDRLEIQEYYGRMSKNNMNAHTFSTIERYYEYIAKYHIIAEEWKKIAEINGAEGGVGKFFENCKSTSALVERLLIPVVEDAISGDGTKNFVDSFEKQREHIKKYKSLKHQIEECQHILEQVKGFTQNFEQWDKEQKVFNQLKGQAKAIYYLIESQHNKNINEHKKQLEEEEHINKDINDLSYKEASYKLLILKNEVEEKNKLYQEALEEYGEMERQVNQANHRMVSLEYAQISQALEDTHKEEESIQKAIKRLSQDNPTAEIEGSLEENSQYIKGYYENAIDEIEKDRLRFENEKTRNNDGLIRSKSEKEGLEKQRKDLEKSQTENKVKITQCQKEMQDIERNILDMPQHENIEDQKVKFQNRFQVIETEIRQGYDTVKALETEQVTLSDNKLRLTQELDMIKESLFKNENTLDNFKIHEEQILQKIHTVNYKWSHMDTIYDSSLIISSIETQIEKTRLELNKAVQEERISLRWLDDYETGDHFIADPRIASQIKEWKKQFALLLTGSEYIQDTSRGNFPYWAITLITTDQEVDKLKSYIEQNKEYINYPIWVMSDHEAVQYLNSDYSNENNIIFPQLWESNINQSTFKEWKNQLREKSKLIVANRQEIQNTYENWETLKKEVLGFKEEYPSGYIHELRTDNFRYKEERNAKENSLTTIYNREKEIIKKVRQLGKQEIELEKERSDLTSKIQQIIRYQGMAKDIANYQKELEEIILPKLAMIRSDVRKLEKSIQDLNEQQYELRDLLREKERNKDQIQNNYMYQEVKSYTPLYSSYSIEILTDERKNLKSELEQRQKGRRELEEQLVKINKERNGYEERRGNHLLRYPNLDPNIRFIAEHTDEIKNLIQKIKALDKQVKHLEQEKVKSKTKYDNCHGDYQGKAKDFYKIYKEIYQWVEPLIVVGSNLQKERKDLNSRLKYTQEQIKRTTQELEETKEIKNTLEIKNGRFQYLRDDIPTNQLNINEELDILYQKEKYTNIMIKNLEQTEDTVKIKLGKLKKEEDKFTHFCRSQIRDIRLQEMTLRGIEKLTQYEEVCKWESNLNKRIMQAKKIAEDDIKTHEEELENFIEFLHSYIRQVADGLGEIDRKTRIKIDGKWKDVYTIKVSDWEKLKGKEAIQNYILWIIEQLESGKYPEETHRREIEKWLSAKQLLGIVTPNQAVVVRCRKLTNQNTLASLASSWESSNKWSGGEKWSKNMILFLGLLNYIAEKTGHVIEGEKRNKAVILDNPFGQASSDHVLNPVFFVAEQLGFQIITLTALVEGSFIRKYFPVVYSCRLRQATDGNQIISKELQIQRALFKDDELPSIGRLETQEQLSLLLPN